MAIDDARVLAFEFISKNTKGLDLKQTMQAAEKLASWYITGIVPEVVKP